MPLYRMSKCFILTDQQNPYNEDLDLRGRDPCVVGLVICSYPKSKAASLTRAKVTSALMAGRLHPTTATPQPNEIHHPSSSTIFSQSRISGNNLPQTWLQLSARTRS